MKNNLEIARDKINVIDAKMIELFKERMKASKMVALYKRENNLDVFDSKREGQIIDKNLNILNDKELEKYYLIFFEGVLKASKDYQKELIKWRNMDCLVKS